MTEDLARLEAEIDRIGQESQRLRDELSRVKADAAKALDLVREAGDCVLLSCPAAGKDRIREAAKILLGICGGGDASH